MDQKVLYDKVCNRVSKLTTRSYSTSFSFGIRCLDKNLRTPIYSIYGFVRFADEIVDTFHDYNKNDLLQRFRDDTWKAIEDKISLNPILHSFQATVHQFKIDHPVIDSFLDSMAMDLSVKQHNEASFQQYILGSAEAVGLMCLRVFCKDEVQYQRLKPSAMCLGAAFQKINFLRDLNQDYNNLGRVYFPGIDVNHFDDEKKRLIEKQIKEDFGEGLAGIKQLPRSARLGVYVAYLYYMALFKKISELPSDYVMKSRVRIKNRVKLAILGYSFLKHQFNLI